MNGDNIYCFLAIVSVHLYGISDSDLCKAWLLWKWMIAEHIAVICKLCGLCREWEPPRLRIIRILTNTVNDKKKVSISAMKGFVSVIKACNPSIKCLEVLPQTHSNLHRLPCWEETRTRTEIKITRMMSIDLANLISVLVRAMYIWTRLAGPSISTGN